MRSLTYSLILTLISISAIPAFAEIPVPTLSDGEIRELIAAMQNPRAAGASVTEFIKNNDAAVANYIAKYDKAPLPTTEPMRLGDTPAYKHRDQVTTELLALIDQLTPLLNAPTETEKRSAFAKAFTALVVGHHLEYDRFGARLEIDGPMEKLRALFRSAYQVNID